ncbi:MAG: hypothetical protein IKD72_00080 [Clostridia bacterium]|nr:hypothetical protein [Clostridia bacterium]
MVSVPYAPPIATACQWRRAFAGGMHSGTGGAKIASLYEGGVEQSETEGVLRLRRLQNTETAFPALPADDFLIVLRTKLRSAGAAGGMKIQKRPPPGRFFRDNNN